MRIQGEYGLLGLVYSDGCLFTHEEQSSEETGIERSVHYLSVYQVQGDSGNIKLLDSLKMATLTKYLPLSRFGVNPHNQRIYFPCGVNGVTVARLKDGRLVRERTLTCIAEAGGLGFMPPDTAYIRDETNRDVYTVDIKRDIITSTLQKPDKMPSLEPRSLAVLGNSVMVGYTNNTHSIYLHGSPAPARVVTVGPEYGVFTINTDCRQYFLLTDIRSKSVMVMDANGIHRQTVKVGTGRDPKDCVVVNGQLWVALLEGGIIIMSTQ